MSEQFLITEPGFYRTNDGDKVEVLVKNPHNVVCRYIVVDSSGLVYSVDDSGRSFEKGIALTPRDITAPWAEPPDFDWSCLAAWHNWIAMDEGGAWFAYGEEPGMDDGFWPGRCDRIPVKYAPKNFNGDWKDSLFERPKE